MQILEHYLKVLNIVVHDLANLHQRLVHVLLLRFRDGQIRTISGFFRRAAGALQVGYGTRLLAHLLNTHLLLVEHLTDGCRRQL